VAAAGRAVRDFPVVCVGGSAGGLDAYVRLLQHLPADMGVAVVIVNHLRIVATRLHEILPRHTKMPVALITDRLLIEPNHVFIIRRSAICMCSAASSASSGSRSRGDGPT
jgi:chemotaxis response regulator CheB